MNRKCQVFTPQDYVKELLNSVGYTTGLMGQRLLENSCGDGNILEEVVLRYIKDCRQKNISASAISVGLSKDIVGIEIDKIHYEKCIKKLNCILDKEKIPRLSWQIYNEDFLRMTDLGSFQFIVGNPPYITYSEINKTDQVYLKRTFNSCKKGKFDYSYAFIEQSINLLSDNGKMSYLVPNSIFKTVYGYELRKVILPHVVEIKEYSQKKIFDTALVKSAIIVLIKNSDKQSLCYRSDISDKELAVHKVDLGDKWLFNSVQKRKIRFGDYFKVSYVVATLLNDVFVLRNYKFDNDGNYIIGEHIIEKGIVRKTASPKSFRNNASERIIFPYKYGKKGLLKYEEMELKEQFPGAYKYLFSNRSRLDNRDKDKTAKWFEYGRSQALARINCEKCLISTVVSSEVMVYKVSKNCIPYGGMFIVPKEANQEYDLDDCIDILKCNEFKEYANSVGIHINGNSVRITASDIENYSFEREINGRT